VQLNALDSHPQRRTENTIGPINQQEADASFDDLDDLDDNPASDRRNGPPPIHLAPPLPPADIENEIVQPEMRSISIPSNWFSVDNIYRAIEVELRISQAERTLEVLRNLVADKSFQYSHGVRTAPRKAVKTRSRSSILTINHRIAFHCKVYARCRTALVKLKVDNGILTKYRTLSKDDIRISTTLLDPNKPGSTRVELSWIWLMGTLGPEESSEALRECK
jgi:hypothetical protein